MLVSIPMVRRTPESTSADRDPPWREPTQERSRRRVEAMLQAAAAQIAEHGVDRLSMSRVAADAGVPIGSLYQFFPDRDALLARLMARYLDRLDRDIAERYRGVTTIEDFVAASEGLVGAVYESLAGDPAFAEIWTGIQASKAVRHLDLESSRRNATLLFDILRPLVDPAHEDARLHTACFLICDLIGATARTAMGMPREDGDLLVREFEAMARVYMMTFLPV